MVNIEPLKDGHVMILPVRHAENLSDLTPEEARSFMQAVDRCMDAVTKLYTDLPMFLVNGWGYRTQPHLHGHVLPSKFGIRGLYEVSEGVERRATADPVRLTKITEDFKPFFKENL